MKATKLVTMLALLFVACDGTPPGRVRSGGFFSLIQSGDCAFEAAASFSSIEEHECGLGPDGEAFCHWSLSLLSDGTFSWSHSDVSERGIWTCEGTQVTGVSVGGSTIIGIYDPISRILTWNGFRYVQLDPNDWTG